MPLILSNGWNLKEDVVTRLIVESLGTSQFKIGDLNRGTQIPLAMTINL